MNFNKKAFFINISLSVFVLVFSVGCIELVLRGKGYIPAKTEDFKPVTYEYDAVLGWKHKTGKYSMFDGKVKVTKWKDGTRASGPKYVEKQKKIILTGCSFIEGWAISDNDTLAWKLQEKYPSIQFINFGTSGYGTYQSLLILENALKKYPNPLLVFYGLFDQHEERNVATAEWLKAIRDTGKRGHVYIPYCTVDSRGNIVRHPPEAYPGWPLRESMVCVSFVEDLFENWRGKGRNLQKRAVTERLLLEISDKCKQSGTEFAVLILSCSPETSDSYTAFFRKHGIHFLNCQHPAIFSPEMSVPFDKTRHPNGRLNDFWLGCVSKYLND